MKNRKSAFSGISAIIFAALVLILCGCEDNTEGYVYDDLPNISALTISPSSASLDLNDSHIILVALGGTSPYHWNIRDASLARLDTNIAASVVYNRVGQEEGVNIVHLRDANNWTAEATIMHTTNMPPDETVTSY